MPIPYELGPVSPNAVELAGALRDADMLIRGGELREAQKALSDWMGNVTPNEVPEESLLIADSLVSLAKYAVAHEDSDGADKAISHAIRVLLTPKPEEIEPFTVNARTLLAFLNLELRKHGVPDNIVFVGPIQRAEEDGDEPNWTINLKNSLQGIRSDDATTFDIAATAIQWARSIFQLGPLHDKSEPAKRLPPSSEVLIKDATLTGGQPLAVIADLEAVPAEIVIELLSALDELHRAHGGGGLRILRAHTGSEVLERTAV